VTRASSAPAPTCRRCSRAAVSDHRPGSGLARQCVLRELFRAERVQGRGRLRRGRDHLDVRTAGPAGAPSALAERAGQCMEFDAEGNLGDRGVGRQRRQRVDKTDMRTGRSVILADLLTRAGSSMPERGQHRRKGPDLSPTPRYEGSNRSNSRSRACTGSTPTGSVHRIIANATKPNGVYVAPDQSTLYVAISTPASSTGTAQSRGTRVDPAAADDAVGLSVNPDGTVGERRALVNYLPKFGPDGITADSNATCTSPRARRRRRRHPGVHA